MNIILWKLAIHYIIRLDVLKWNYVEFFQRFMIISAQQSEIL